VKAKNLKILQDNGINVPHFVVLSTAEELTPALMFMIDPDKKYAVRSSFAVEDGKNLSYAGQFDTLLNVKKEDLKNAVEKVFQSQQNQNVHQYNEINGIEMESLGGRVIIQEMVDAEISGVIFTANPLGILNETVITIGQGLGSNVVEDRVDTTSYFYNRDDNTYYCEQQNSSPLIDEYMLKKLLRLSNDIQKIFGYNVDIEFAIKSNHIFVLQARAITTLSASSPIVLDNSNIVESYPGVSLPLTQDFVKAIYHDIFYNLVLRISKDKALVDDMDKYLQDMTDIANWRIYYRISNWYAVLKLLPFSQMIIPVWQRMLGISNTLVTYPTDINVSLKTKFTVLRSFIHYLRKTPKYMEVLNQSFEQKINKYQKQIADADTISGLINVYESIKSDVLIDWDITLINDMYAFIHTALSGDKNKEAIANIKNLESMRPVIAMNSLVSIAKDGGIKSKQYRKAAMDYVEEFGDRCLCELKLETKTYRTNPELLDAYINRMLTTPEYHMHQETVVNESRHLNPFAKRARVGIKNRETSRLNRSRIFGLSRSIFLKIGDMLVDSGKLNTARDVFYLHIDELDSDQDFHDVVERRKSEFENFEKIPAYSRLVFSERVFDKQNTILQSSVLTKSNTLYGIASSMGKIVGTVLVVDEPNDQIDTAGKILVTKSTDPGWVFLIQNAIGIIAEKGSLLSHTAIISRELHKPSIVNVKDCTRLLRTGDVVELNADNGIIQILERSQES
jgi:pyruvate,water dikinase